MGDSICRRDAGATPIGEMLQQLDHAPLSSDLRFFESVSPANYCYNKPVKRPETCRKPSIVCNDPARIALLLFLVLFTIPSIGIWAQKPGGELKIVEVLFEDYNGGYSSRWEMRAGEEVSLNFRVEGFRRLAIENQEGLHEEHVDLHYQIELRDPQGMLVTQEKQGDLVTTLGPRDEKWRPMIDWSAQVPASAPGGIYSVRIQVTDRIANRESVRNVSFRVRGDPIAASNNLQIVQLEYANSEGGPWNPERYFALHEPIWVRYKVVGYGVSPEKQVWVEHDWTVLDDSGKVIVTQENASVEKQQNSYPPRFLATIFSVGLENPKPGKYLLRIELRDRIGEQTATYESSFFLRP